MIIFSGQDGSVFRTILGGTSDQFADAVAGLGDVTGDGVPDYLIGTDRRPFAHPDPLSRVHLYSGRTGARLRTYKATEERDNFGREVTILDLNGLQPRGSARWRACRRPPGRTSCLERP